VAAENTVERDKEERELSAKRKKNREVGFLSTFHPIFFTLSTWNPPLFIGDER
jgi:hypothetical protein